MIVRGYAGWSAVEVRGSALEDYAAGVCEVGGGGAEESLGLLGQLDPSNIEIYNRG